MESGMAKLHDQIGIDLAKHAGDRAAKAMLEAIGLCETRAQASMVAFQVMGIVAAQACAAINAHQGNRVESPADMLEAMASLMRKAKDSAHG
jgi:hypothetical protein